MAAPQLALSFQNEFSSVACNKQLDSFLGVVSLVAPEQPPSETDAPRTAVDIVAVLDRSGSMAGEKMKMLHKTVDLLIQHLTPNDRLSLVAYDDTVETPLHLTKMDDAGKNLARQALKTINDRGCTNLSGGLFQGLEILAGRSDGKNEVSSVLLMTDGLANAGITSGPQLVEATKRKLASMNNPTTVYTFGFGSDHDANLLGQIADAGRGGYYFMKNEDAIPQAFADCIGGLMSVMAQNIELTFSAGENIHINNVETTFKNTAVTPNQKYIVNVGDIFAQERKDFLIDFRLPTTPGPVEAQPTIAVNLSYFDIASVSTKTLHMVCTVGRTAPDSADGATSTQVDEQRNRVRTVKAMEQAMQLGNQGNLTQAREVLQQCQQMVQTSASAAQSAGLMQDMTSVLQDMQSASQYREVAHKKLNVKTRKHAAQRAYECDDAEVNMYANNAKVSMRSAFK